jgi:hypothetical protein
LNSCDGTDLYKSKKHGDVALESGTDGTILSGGAHYPAQHCGRSMDGLLDLLNYF